MFRLKLNNVRRESLIIAVFTLSGAFGLTCAADNYGNPGFCIDATWSFFGQDIYKSCFFNPYYTSGSMWRGYEICYAAVRTGNLSSDAGSPIVEYWTNETNKLLLCKDFNGAECDVKGTDGFTLDAAATDRGFCDASDENCVKCDTNNIELKKWLGGSWITGTGDGLCESGCGAHVSCDEVSSDTYTGACDNERGLYCNSACDYVTAACRIDCGSHNLCHNSYPSDVCATDYCTSNHTLIDYNSNQLLDSVTCTSNCDCDNVYDTPLCDLECGSQIACDAHPIGYNNGNAGCINSCEWVECGLYSWADISCYVSCTDNSHCFNSVCDLVGGGINNCVIDSDSPIISITYPASFVVLNHSLNLQFIVSDEVDPELACYYSINDGSPFSMGSFNQGMNSFEVIPGVQGLLSINGSCFDDTGNVGYSSHQQFFYDVDKPTYSNHGYSNQSGGQVLFTDFLVLHAFWEDNTYLDSSLLWTNKTGDWLFEGLINYCGSPSAGWSNFTLNLSDYGDTEIAWYIITNDTAGNYEQTVQDSFHVYYNATTDIEVLINADPNDSLAFNSNGQLTLEAYANNSLRTSLLGDINVTHVGVGLPINISAWLNNSIGSEFNMKINNEFDYETAISLSTSEQEVCSEVMPSQVCQLWVWLDWTGESSLGEITSKIDFRSYNLEE